MTSTTVHSRNRASFPTRRSSDLLREVIATLPRAVQEEQERVGAVRIVAVREMQEIFACEAALDRALEGCKNLRARLYNGNGGSRCAGARRDGDKGKSSEGVDGDADTSSSQPRVNPARRRPSM